MKGIKIVCSIGLICIAVGMSSCSISDMGIGKNEGVDTEEAVTADNEAEGLTGSDNAGSDTDNSKMIYDNDILYENQNPDNVSYGERGKCFGQYESHMDTGQQLFCI